MLSPLLILVLKRSQSSGLWFLGPPLTMLVLKGEESLLGSGIFLHLCVHHQGLHPHCTLPAHREELWSLGDHSTSWYQAEKGGFLRQWRLRYDRREAQSRVPWRIDPGIESFAEICIRYRYAKR